MAELFRLVLVGARDEFTEDNDATSYDFTRGRFEEAVDMTYSYHGPMREAYTQGQDGQRPRDRGYDYLMSL